MLEPYRMGEVPRLNLLIAYPYITPPILSRIGQLPPDRVRLLVDSGAFTAWKAKKPIKVSDYIRFLHRLPIPPWRYFVLDVIGDPVGTEDNLRSMKKAGLSPVPIFTRGEDFGRLDGLYERSEVVALGGLVGTPENAGYVKRFMREAAGRPCHWLGFTDYRFIASLAPYSCDCSSWGFSCRMATASFYLGGGRMTTIERIGKRMYDPTHENRNRDKMKDPKVVTGLASYGLTPTMLLPEAAWAGQTSLAMQLTGRSYIRRMMETRRERGTLFFLACNSLSDIDLLWECYEKEVERWR